MTEDTPRYVPDPDDPSDPVAIHKIAADQFARALRAMNELTAAFDEGDLEAASKTRDWSTILAKATQTLMDEQSKLNALLKDGEDERAEIDYDKVRADLQRQLARIAAARTSE